MTNQIDLNFATKGLVLNPGSTGRGRSGSRGASAAGGAAPKRKVQMISSGLHSSNLISAKSVTQKIELRGREKEENNQCSTLISNSALVDLVVQPMKQVQIFPHDEITSGHHQNDSSIVHDLMNDELNPLPSVIVSNEFRISKESGKKKAKSKTSHGLKHEYDSSLGFMNKQI